MHKEGRPYVEIARHFKVSASTVFFYTKLKERFKSTGEYNKYLELRKIYGQRLLELVNYLRPIGYDIEDLRDKNDGLVIKLLKEKDTDFNKDFVETTFRDSLEESLLSIDVNGNFKISYKENTVFIKPNNFKSRAFLDAYKKVILEREIFK